VPEIATSGPLLEVARSLRARILAERDRIEASRRLPDDIARELAHAGFFRIFLPAAYGGLDLTPMEGLEMFEELPRADASVALCVWNGNTHWTAAQLSPEAARTIHNDPATGRGSPTRMSFPNRAIAYPRFPALFPAWGQWR
jgi:indole-3-acetate monooxygenase